MNKIFKLIAISSVAVAGACSTGGKQAAAAETPKSTAEVPDFNADSAYAYVAAQTAFGPRVPGSAASAECARWLAATLHRLGAQNVVEQRTQVRDIDGKPLDICNITARINPQAKKRVLLMAHWDSRPWADQEENPADREIPIDGANDGASGVGVILELVRALGQTPVNVGVDVLFADAEDSGRRSDQPRQNGDEASWCLGTQYWVENPTFDLGDIRFAVLLDMVGGIDAVFPKEYFSQSYSPDINEKVWEAAQKAGYADRFSTKVGSPVIDDHIYLIRAGVPAIDIIETQHPAGTGFNPTWHTHADNIDNIDPATLKAVGQTLAWLLAQQ